MVKRLLTIVLLGSLAVSASAQQLANTTFDATWVDCFPWEAGNYVSDARGTQPEGWCISNVSQSALPIVGEEVTPGANGSGKAVKLSNVAASIGSNNAPGYITLGTAWATAETKMTSVRNADGGVFGGITFSYHPDALRFTYKHDISQGAENMSVIAYLWKGTWTQESVPSNTAIGVFSWGTATKVTMTNRINNILGKTCLTGGNTNAHECTHSDDAALIASVEFYEKTQQKNWTTREIALNYGSYAGQSVDVEMLNIVISANGLFEDRSTIKSGNSVTIDDVELVYWHALSALSYEGATLNFSENTTSYNLSSVEYDEAKLSYSIKGQAATATTSYDEETAVLTIRVEGEDFASNSSSFTEYTIQFKVPSVGPKVVSSKTYSEDLYVTVAGETSDKQVADVLVETLDNGNINFVLKNFVLGEGEDATPVGNIAVNDIVVADDGSFVFNGGIEIAEGDASEYAADDWAGPGITMMCDGSVPLNMSGKFIGDDHVVVYIGIDITSVLQAMGDVQVHLGYDRAVLSVSDAKYGTFAAPVDITLPEGVTAYKVASVDNTGVLELTKAADAGETLAAGTAVVVASESPASAEAYFYTTETSTTTDLLTGVYEPTDITSGYVLQNLDDKVAFYLVDSEITVPANRCYLTAPAGSVKALAFPDGTLTSISEIQAADEKAVIYDLSGRRVSKATKGIYIINGKKVIK
ncbi:MAG: hypothetical protein IJK94_00920 [Bacteroidaceae bacterium]|nr:hypothetical protein [Bacteroidaceae bacterium]